MPVPTTFRSGQPKPWTPAGHRTPAQEEALAQEVQTDEQHIERVGDETAAREVDSDPIPTAGGKEHIGPAQRMTWLRAPTKMSSMAFEKDGLGRIGRETCPKSVRCILALPEIIPVYLALAGPEQPCGVSFRSC